MINIAILGFGTVGSGVYDVITQNKDVIQEKCEQRINVKRVLDIRDFPDHPVQKILTRNFEDILHDDEISIIVECVGGLDPVYGYTKKALIGGKSVITSNKEMVAAHGPEMLAVAEENNVRYLLEASVGGGIPIIRPILQCLAANHITEIYGILNGTTNYILTRMVKNGESFDDALKLAQENGYAERDPAADVEGHDTCRKIAILASLAFGKNVSWDSIPTTGITKVTVEDAKKAEEQNCVLKLIGHAKLEDGEIVCKVEPTLVPKDSPLAGVDDVYNGIMIRGDFVGDVMFYGRGAGKYPTASAVVADIIDIVRHV